MAPFTNGCLFGKPIVPVAISPGRTSSCSQPAKHFLFINSLSIGSIHIESASKKTPPYLYRISHLIISAFPLISSISSILSWHLNTKSLFLISASFQKIYSKSGCLSFQVFINVIGDGFLPIHN